MTFSLRPFHCLRGISNVTSRYERYASHSRTRFPQLEDTINELDVQMRAHMAELASTMQGISPVPERMPLNDEWLTITWVRHFTFCANRGVYESHELSENEELYKMRAQWNEMMSQYCRAWNAYNSADLEAFKGPPLHLKTCFRRHRKSCSVLCGTDGSWCGSTGERCSEWLECDWRNTSMRRAILSTALSAFPSLQDLCNYGRFLQ